ncbi:MAG: hypothetical protein R3266_09560 [Gemmatimonadota bacterium]|nr:hypothetical protein [Gemmatimonadota bacterium]
MSATIKAEGDTWRARLGAVSSAGNRTLLFFCESTDQRPYRVVELEAGRFASEEDLAEASDEELLALFAESRSMGAPKEYPTYGS